MRQVRYVPEERRGADPQRLRGRARAASPLRARGEARGRSAAPKMEDTCDKSATCLRGDAGQIRSA